jgi:hypothetical protein
MTPFDTWYSTIISPVLEPTLKNLPAPAREPMRKASRESMAASWNACIDELWRLSQEVRGREVVPGEPLPTVAIMEPFEYPIFEMLRSLKAETERSRKAADWMADWKRKHGLTP